MAVLTFLSLRGGSFSDRGTRRWRKSSSTFQRAIPSAKKVPTNHKSNFGNELTANRNRAIWRVQMIRVTWSWSSERAVWWSSTPPWRSSWSGSRTPDTLVRATIRTMTLEHYSDGHTHITIIIIIQHHIWQRRHHAGEHVPADLSVVRHVARPPHAPHGAVR